MTELQIQQDLEGKIKGFKFTGKGRKSRHFPEEKQTGLGIYAKLERE